MESCVEHIWRQHKGWRNSKGKSFFLKKAQQIRMYMENACIVQSTQPRLRRMFYVCYMINGERMHIAFVARDKGFKGKRWRTPLPDGAKILSTERVWRVHMLNWSRLIFAQAERDGRNYHYAWHLMVKGTPARGII